MTRTLTPLLAALLLATMPIAHAARLPKQRRQPRLPTRQKSSTTSTTLPSPVPP